MRHPSRLILIALLFAALHPTAISAQSRPAAEQEVRDVVERLFDAMRAGDSAGVRATFAADARLVSTGARDGKPSMQAVPIDRFIEAVGQPHDEVWDERIWDVEIRIDDHLATVWNQYAFFLGETFSHCGVDAFQLFRSADGWRIFHLADTRRQEGCDVPD